MSLETTALVFDLDGTLSDPSLGICRCFNFALEECGYGGVPDELVAAEIGPPLDETFYKLAPHASKSDVQLLITKYRERYAEVGFSENELYLGIPEAIDHLTSAGLKLGVCTSKRRDFAEKILAMFGLLPSFEFVDGGDVGIKKSQQLSSLVVAGLIDQGAVMIGDRNIDILAARSNGLRSIGVLWGFGSSCEIAGVAPDYMVGEIGELVQLVI
ncbi:MAG: HAD hydrolase-like protein [Gammaproteobacteria bacterium]